MTEPLKVVGYRKSGNHFVRALLMRGGHDVRQSHLCGPSDIHIVRDPRAIVVSWICHFILGRPELDPDLITPHIDTVVEGMTTTKYSKQSWCDYVIKAKEESWHTIRYRDLVTDPYETLYPIADIGDAAEILRTEIQQPGAWDEHKFRQGDPDGWIDVLSISQATELAYVFRRGMDAVGLY